MRYGVLIIWVLVLASCDKQEYFGPVYTQENDSLALDSSNTLAVGCEGNFQYGNASLSVISLNTQEVQNQVFQTVNQEPLGDVLQSVRSFGDRLYLVVNNSGKVRITDPKTLEQLAVIEELVSPRDVLCVNGKLLISDLYSDHLTLFDSASLDPIGTIETGGWTERFQVFNRKVVVGGIDTRSLIVLDESQAFEREVHVYMQPFFLYRNSLNQLIVAGNRSETDQTGVIRILGENYHEIDSMAITSTIVGAWVGGDDMWLLTRKEILHMQSQTLEVLGSFKHGLINAYGLAVKTDKSELFIADARDYLSNGTVVSFDPKSGNRKNEYEVGVIPQSMFFLP